MRFPHPLMALRPFGHEEAFAILKRNPQLLNLDLKPLTLNP